MFHGFRNAKTASHGKMQDPEYGDTGRLPLGSAQTTPRQATGHGERLALVAWPSAPCGVSD